MAFPLVLAGMALKAKPVLVFVRKHYDTILLIAIAAVVVLLIASLMVGKARWETKYNEEVAAHAKTSTAYANERTKAADLALLAERLEREKEHVREQAKSEQEARDAKRDADWNDRVRNLNGTKRELLNHIARLTAYSGASAGSAATDPATDNLPERLAACGSLLARSTDIGRRCAADYGTAHNTWQTCVGHIEVERKE